MHTYTQISTATVSNCRSSGIGHTSLSTYITGVSVAKEASLLSIMIQDLWNLKLLTVNLAIQWQAWNTSI